MAESRDLTYENDSEREIAKMPALANTFLFSEPDDNYLNYGSVPLHQIVEANKQPGQSITELMGADANPERIKLELANLSPIIFGGIGHGCYSEDTEILTENGWKLFSLLQPDEKVATLSQDDELVYQTPTAHISYFYKGKMFNVNGSRINLLVTPNHNLFLSWLGHNGKMLPFKFIQAQDIGKKGYTNSSSRGWRSTGKTMGNYLRFKRTAKWNCLNVVAFEVPAILKTYSNQLGFCKTIPIGSKEVRIEDWLRFFGIWLAEGSASVGQKIGEYIISVAQNNDKKRPLIKEWVQKVGVQVGFSCWEEASNAHSKCIKFKNKQIFEYLKQFGHARDKFIPNELLMMKPKLLSILFEAMLLGDGYTDPHGNWAYYTSSKKLADNVQELALKIGQSATIKKYRDMYKVYFSKTDAGISKRSWEWINYEGNVYCVTVPNHLVYVRRNGKPCWCGNSPSVFTVQNLTPFLHAENPDELALMKERVVLLTSCLTAQQLGPALIDAGAVVYAGYKEEFWFYTGDVAGTTRAVQSPFLAEFQITASLLQGKTTGEAQADQLAKYDEEIAYWITGEGKNHPDAMELARILEINKSIRVFLGESTVSPSPQAGALAGMQINPIITFGVASIPIAYLIYKVLA